MTGHLDVGGTRLAYRLVGSGPRTVTCLHSLALSGSWFLPLTDALGPGYRFLLPDLRGHGESAPGPLPISLENLAGDVRVLWDHLGIARSDVLGISLGGMVAQAVAALFPERVDRLVLIATTGTYDDAARQGTLARAAAAREPGGLAGMIDPLLDRWFGADRDPADELAAGARAEFLRADPEVHASFLEAMPAVGSFRLDTPAPPTLVLGGQDDGSTPGPVVEALAAGIPGATLDVLPGAHLLAFTHPEAVARRVAPFLETAVDRATPVH